MTSILLRMNATSYSLTNQTTIRLVTEKKSYSLHKLEIIIVLLMCRITIVTGKTMGMRHVQMLMATASLTIIYVYRVNMSIAIVVMTNKTNSNPDFPVNIFSNIGLSSYVINCVAMCREEFAQKQHTKSNVRKIDYIIIGYFWFSSN